MATTVEAGGGDASTTAAPTQGTTVTSVVSAASGEATAGTLVLLSDDFQDGDAAGWDVDSGWFVLGAGSEYRLASSGAAWAWWPGGENWEPRYVLRSSIRVDRGGLAVSIAVGDEGRYVVHLHEDGTDLLLDRPWGTFETRASGAAIEAGEWHALAVGVDGGEIQVYVDGNPLITAEAANPFTEGSVGFGALDGSLVAIDNVIVTVLRAGLPAVAFPQPVAAPAAPAAPVVDEPPEDDGGGDGDGDDEPQAELPEQDVYLASVSFEGDWHVAGEPITVRMRVSNGGTRALGPFAVAWESMGSSCEAEVDGLPALTPIDVSCTAPGLPAGIHPYTVYVDHDDRIAEADEGNNSLSHIIEVTAAPPTRPDLFIAASNATDDPVGSEFDMWVIVADQNEVGFDRSFTTRFVLDGQLVCSVDRTGDNMQSRCAFSGLSAGAHLVEVITDAEGEIAETREDNNNFICEMEVQGDAADLPDLRVRGVITFDAVPGEPFTIQAIIEDANDVGFDGAYTVRFYADGQMICSVNVQGAVTDPSCDYPGMPAGDHVLEVVVDSGDEIAETNEVNNCLLLNEEV